MAATSSSSVLGSPAPDFRLPATDGQTYALDDIAGEKGAVIVWPTLDTNPAPPLEIAARFPGLVPEVPRTFPRLVRGRLPPLLIGWGVIRPASAPAAASPTASDSR